ncbi:hypothetical protein M426DRAFT_18491 [Hypoxylon sp. CI-4A]|nr:hypothetical protein M426DRAFT_18491 [Hypoxylon sp. CI-4A]
MARFHELEGVACDVIHHVKQMRDLQNAKLSVIGGLALWHYLPEYRTTDNINFITNLSTSPSSLKKRLLERPNSPFFQRSQALFYEGPRGQEIRIDISPQWLGPYLPESAQEVQDLETDEIPYISLTDLIVFKLDSSGLRSNPIKKERDARDAAALVDLVTHDGSIELSEKQEQVVEEALCDVRKCGTKEKGWWEKRMGLTGAALEPDGLNDDGKKRSGRPHSKSDPSPSRTPINNDPNAAWCYERLDHTHMRYSKTHHNSNNIRDAASRKLVRSSSSSSSHGRMKPNHKNHHTMNQPKTSNSNLHVRIGTSRSGLRNEISADLGHDHHGEEQYYTLEPPGTPPRRDAPPGYFDVPRAAPGDMGTLVEHAHPHTHTPVGIRRPSKAGFYDVSPGSTPSAVAEPRRPPLQAMRSVSFVL